MKIYYLAEGSQIVAAFTDEHRAETYKQTMVGKNLELKSQSVTGYKGDALIYVVPDGDAKFFTDLGDALEISSEVLRMKLNPTK